METKSENLISVSAVYTFAMAKIVYIQLRGLEKSIAVDADKIEKSGTIGTLEFKLSVTRSGTEVGQFNGNEVVGWWIEG